MKYRSDQGITGNTFYIIGGLMNNCTFTGYLAQDPELLKVAVSIDAIPKKKRLWFESFIQ